MTKKIPVSLIVVLLIISLSIVVGWVRERGPESTGARMVANSHPVALWDVPEDKTRVKEQPVKDCDAWAGMNVKEKKGKYRADPERWARCLCQGEGCELDRLYITGKLSR